MMNAAIEEYGVGARSENGCAPHDVVFVLLHIKNFGDVDRFGNFGRNMVRRVQKGIFCTRALLCDVRYKNMKTLSAGL